MTAKNKLVTNVSKNPVTLNDGTVIEAGKSASVDPSILKGDIFYEAGYVVDGEVRPVDESADVADLRKQLTALENAVHELTTKNEELSDSLGQEKLRADTTESALSDAGKAKK